MTSPLTIEKLAWDISLLQSLPLSSLSQLTGTAYKPTPSALCALDDFTPCSSSIDASVELSRAYVTLREEVKEIQQMGERRMNEQLNNKDETGVKGANESGNENVGKRIDSLRREAEELRDDLSELSREVQATSVEILRTRG